MSDLDTALISQFVILGCSQQNAAAASQIYLELTEVRKLFDVKYHYDNDMKRMYFTAKNSKSEKESVFFPVCTFESVSFSMMNDIMKLNNSNTFYLAIISPDSTCVYYQITDGLIEFSPSTVVSKISSREKHDSELSHKREEIEKQLNITSECKDMSDNKD